MRFSNLLLTAVAFAGAANAMVQFTNSVFNNVTAGKPFTLTWSNATAPVTINLKNGPDAYNLNNVQLIVSGATGNSYTWNVPATLPADTYAFEISDGGPKPNYSVRFQLIGGVTTTKSSSSTASASATTSGSSSATTTDDSSSTTTRSSTRSSATQSETSATPSPTSAPSGGMAAGFTSNLAFVFLVVGALMTLN